MRSHHPPSPEVISLDADALWARRALPEGAIPGGHNACHRCTKPLGRAAVPGLVVSPVPAPSVRQPPDLQIGERTRRVVKVVQEPGRAVHVTGKVRCIALQPRISIGLDDGADLQRDAPVGRHGGTVAQRSQTVMTESSSGIRIAFAPTPTRTPGGTMEGTKGGSRPNKVAVVGAGRVPRRRQSGPPMRVTGSTRSRTSSPGLMTTIGRPDWGAARLGVP